MSLYPQTVDYHYIGPYTAISGELLSSDGTTSSNLYIYCMWCSVMWLFYVRKQHKGGDVSKYDYTNRNNLP